MAQCLWQSPSGQSHTQHCVGIFSHFFLADILQAANRHRRQYQDEINQVGESSAEDSRMPTGRTEKRLRSFAELSAPSAIRHASPIFVAINPNMIYGIFRIRSFLFFGYSSQITLLFLFTNLLRQRCHQIFELIKLCQHTRFFIFCQRLCLMLFTNRI